jgi:hypothetical protein
MVRRTPAPKDSQKANSGPLTPAPAASLARSTVSAIDPPTASRRISGGNGCPPGAGGVGHRLDATDRAMATLFSGA